MKIIPCQRNASLKEQIEEFAEVLKTQAHTLGSHGLSEDEFYRSGLFRGAIERVRGQFSATMQPKREFVQHVLNHMQDAGTIKGWESAGEANRHDYVVTLCSERVAAIELKGCLDGNNTNIFERPPHAQEFIVWSVCTNPGADPEHNAWSGVHTRLSAEIISREQRVDGLIIWDMVCGTVGRPCPKLIADPNRKNMVGPFSLPPPCIYTFPETIPSPRNNPNAKAQSVENVEILEAFRKTFGAFQNEVARVDFDVKYEGADTVRRTSVTSGSGLNRTSGWTAIKRS
ncbi:hypothetical protein [Henriciella pelagia]|jgi:hypothetical protein|uniref:Uncharacterized protein n=1 Tax=Henriciella pelagia TaxID=1977912 RepID=A0ABQ1JGC3_9PROT|nr:hypothetical protein [Henriciella pelagia]GGB65680.1 hypothetical protein GCM10011503_13140 [Henriciella pelagia]